MNRPPFEISDKIVNALAEIENRLGRSDSIMNRKMDLYLRKANMIKTVNSSCAIEANTLTEQQVEGVINGKRIIAPPNEIIEVKNAYDAYVAMDGYEPYETSSFLKAHGILMKQLQKDAGRYRATDVAVYDRGNIIHVGARPQFISGLMDDLFKWAGASELNPIIKACVLHYEIETVHPFPDGNGRIGRLWQSVILCRYNELFRSMPIETLVHANQQRYYEAIEMSRRENSSTAFIEFMLEMILRTMDEFGSNDGLHQIKKEYIRDLTKGAKEMLAAILKDRGPDSIIAAGSLVETVNRSDSAIRNRLKELTDAGILTAYGNNKGRRYVLNKNVLL